MEHRLYRIIALMLVLVMLVPSAMLAMADVPEELDLNIDGSGLIQGGEGDLLSIEGDRLDLDGGLGDGLVSGDLLDVTPSGEGTEAVEPPQIPETEIDLKDDGDQTASEADESAGAGDDAGEQIVDIEEETDEAAGGDAETAPGEVADELPGETDDAALALQSNDISAPEDVGAGEGSLESVTVSGGMDNDAMFEAYMRQVLPGMAPRLRMIAANSRSVILNGFTTKIYDDLMRMIRDVAGGNRTSTVFYFDAETLGTEDHWWSAEDLGLESLNDGGLAETLLAKEGFGQENRSKLLQAVLADCPYHLYWFDKTNHEGKPSGMGFGYNKGTKTENGITYVRLTRITVKMVVAKDYSKTDEIGTYEVNDLPRRVSDAVANIDRIVADNKSKGDEDKLWAYANAVCGLVAYNADALKPDTPYGDPWQLVFIFDGDDSTNVVCEGYSKGFKYLCDRSSFAGDVACEMMIGTIPAGNHMWNTVHMSDGRNYLVDLTNSDGGSSCNGKYYMKGCAGAPATGYTCNGLNYQYGDRMASTFGEGWLTLSNGDYGKDYTVNVSASRGTLTANPAKADPGQTVTLTLIPDEGCLAAEVTVDHASDLKQTEVGSNVWTFTMPMRDVNAEATCEAFPAATAFSGEYDGQHHGISVMPAGSAQRVTVKYGTTKGAYESDESPTWKDVGTHTVYYRMTVGTVGSVEGEAVVAIVPKTVDLSWETTGFTYDGQGHVPTATATGLIPGDSCAVTVAGEQTNVGNYTATAIKLSNGNYALPVDNTQSFAIGKRTVGLNWGTCDFTYDGQGHAPTAAATGLIPGDSCAVTVAGEQTNAGSYTAMAIKLANGNYALPVDNTQSFAIGKRTVGLNWGTCDFTYDGQGHAPTAAATGLIPGDSCAVTVAGEQTNAGSYTATATGLSNGNYVLPEDLTRTFAIAPKTVALKWSKTKVTYNRKTQKPTVTLVGVLKGDKCTVTVKGSGKNAGFYTIRVTGLSNGNYALPSGKTHVLEIKKKSVKLKWTRTRLKYNGKYQKPTATATGVIKGDKCTVTVTGAKKKRGTYVAKATKLSNKNYQLPKVTKVKFRIY